MLEILYHHAALQDIGRLICVCRFGNLSGDGPVDLVLSCVDNFEARMTINAVRFLH